MRFRLFSVLLLSATLNTEAGPIVASSILFNGPSHSISAPRHQNPPAHVDHQLIVSNRPRVAGQPQSFSSIDSKDVPPLVQFRPSLALGSVNTLDAPTAGHSSGHRLSINNLSGKKAKVTDKYVVSFRRAISRDKFLEHIAAVKHLIEKELKDVTTSISGDLPRVAEVMMHEASTRLPKGFRAYIAVLTETIVKEISGLQGIRIVRDFAVTHTIGQQHKLPKSTSLHRRFVNDGDANSRPKFTSQNIETDFEYGNWGLDRIDQASPVRDGMYLYHPSAGENVTVIIVDSGLIPHDDFKDRVLPGKNFIEGASQNRDFLGHGSFVASLIASREVGVAKKVNVQAYQIMNEDGRTQYANLLRAIFHLSLDVVERKRTSSENIVINLSLGFNAQNGGNIDNDLELELLLKKLIEIGAVVVQAAGNDNVNACHHALYRIPEIIHVGAMSYNSDKKWENSNFGECVDIYAPGHLVLGYNPNQGEFMLASGTSYAAPHVAGAVALYLSTGHFANVDANHLAVAVKQTLIEEAWDVNQEVLNTYNGQIPKVLNSIPSFM